MALSDHLKEEDAREAAESCSKQNPRRTTWDGESRSGVLDTGPVDPSKFSPDDSDEVLKAHNLDPDRWRLTSHVGFSEWDVPFRNRETDELEFHKAQSHKFTFTDRALGLDLPALYAEVEKSRQNKKFTPRTGDSTVVVCWADIQTGKVDHLGGLRELLDRLTDKRENLKQYLARQKFDHIVVADCGDIIEGFQNFDAQTRTNSLSLMDQVDVASTELWKLLKQCAEYAPVDLLSIPSNHCRWAKGTSLIGKTTDDWGLHVNKRLERHNDEIGLPISFHRADDWMETFQFDIRNSTLGMAHGHQANNPDQIKNWWAKMTHAGVLTCDILVTGHFHFPSLRPSGKRPDGRSKWHIQASTLDNGSSWVRNKYGEDGDPALTVFQINDAGFDVNSFALL